MRVLRSLPLLVLAGCVSWHQPAASPRDVIIEVRPPSIRITRPDGRQTTVERPAIARDSIFGAAGIGFAPVAVTEVTMLEVKRFSPVRTIALVTAQAGALVGVLTLIVDFLPHYRGLF